MKHKIPNLIWNFCLVSTTVFNNSLSEQNIRFIHLIIIEVFIVIKSNLRYSISHKKFYVTFSLTQQTFQNKSLPMSIEKWTNKFHSSRGNSNDLHESLISLAE